MKIIFIGTGAGATYGSKRVKSSIYIKSNEGTSVLLDLGTGANFKIEDLNLLDFEAIFITHLHIDHINGLFDHLVQRKILRMKEIQVYSPPGILKVLDSYVKSGNNISANTIENELPKAKISDLEIYSVEACHSIYAVSYIITDGEKKIIYTGDTLEPCETVLDEAKDADLIIHEGSCIDDCRQYGHTSVKQLIEMYDRNKLIITHIPAQIENQVKEIAKGYIIAHDGMMVDV
ncbi:MBL fold metallo-hydrolase [Sulfurisphaera ohwakuensis]|uniref:MBL fold metallo-hydrolase n=1 Tax=Sulfurisphaera ohwakuensis TaxID=69656 RepID=A0A650CJP2_SULOH|nr:MBL fold metallo-hydrolase [Sulfurisphaera ohwakuensis]MBB5253892.1 ribonuclease BN (tRNA processing enzyme) [Sulfurisphaera ohwakuensis]QGR17958.1 MBL fold metallo-hydrolase [Sulfurisphaera ohwakuensis]